MRLTRMIALTLPVAVLLLISAMPVSATPPEVTESAWHEEGTWVDCGTFRIDYQADVQLRTTTRFDSNGDPKTITYFYRYDGTAWNSVTGLTVLNDDASYQAIYDVASNTWTIDGRYWHWTIPGQGLVLIEGGHTVLYQSSNGDWFAMNHGRPHDTTPGGYWFDLTPLCTALA